MRRSDDASLDENSEFLTRPRFVAVAIGLISVALVVCGERLRRGAAFVTEALFAVAFVATGLSVFVIVDAARALLRNRAGRARRVLASIVEGIVVFGAAFVVDPFAAFDGARAYAVAGACVAALVAHDRLIARLPRIGRAVVAIVGGLAWFAHVTTNGALYGSFHMAMCLLVLGSAARVGSFAREGRALRPAVVGSVLVVSLVSAEAALIAPGVRTRFRSESPTAAALARAVHLLADVDRDGTSALLDGHDCAPFDGARGGFAVEVRGDGIDQDCDGIDLPSDRALDPVASRFARPDRPDILVISLDALRADEASRLARTRAALRTPFDFTLAVSPSARTMNSFAAMLRGRTLDELPFDHGSLRSTLRPNDLPTLGGVLARIGYRSVFVATHPYLSPRMRIVSGFEFLRNATMPYDDPNRLELGGMLDAGDALALVAEAARTTNGPLFAWAHLMETHTPYRASRDRIFGTSRDDYERAIEVQDERVAEAIASFRAVRRRPAIIVVLGDHGEAFGEHGARLHSSSLHTEQVRVLFWISLPDTVGRRISSPVSTASLAATLVELAGAPREPSFVLRSIAPCMEARSGCPEAAMSELFSLARPGDVAVRAYTTSTDRTIVDRAHDVACRYDLRSDPRELRPASTTSHEAMRRIASLDLGR